MRKNLQTALSVAVTALSAAALTDALASLLYGVAKVNPLLYRVTEVRVPAFQTVGDCLGAAAVLSCILLSDFRQSMAY